MDSTAHPREAGLQSSIRGFLEAEPHTSIRVHVSYGGNVTNQGSRSQGRGAEEWVTGAPLEPSPSLTPWELQGVNKSSIFLP